MLESKKTRKRTQVQQELPGLPETSRRALPGFDLIVTFDQCKKFVEFVWSESISGKAIVIGRVRCTGSDQLTWETEKADGRDSAVSSHRRLSIRTMLNRWLGQFPTHRDTFRAFWI